MIIKNTTNWDTDDLRKIFAKAKQEADKIEKIPKKKFVVIIRNSRWLKCNDSDNLVHINGRAYLGGRQMTIMISMKENEWTQEAKEKLARIFTHEYYHLLGYAQIDYRNYKNDITTKMNYSWVSNFQVREKEVKQKEKIDIRLIRYGKVKSNLEKAMTRLKRAKTLYQKWQNKIKYYEKICPQFTSKK